MTETVSIHSQSARYVGALEYDRLQARSVELDRVEARLGEARSLYAQVCEKHAALTAEFDAYKAKVREMAIQCADDEGWCAEGLNNALRELGLDERKFRYRVGVELVATQEVSVEVEAVSEDEAADKALDLDDEALAALVDGSGWSIRADDYSYIDSLGSV